MGVLHHVKTKERHDREIPTQRKAADILALLEPMEDPKLLKVARIALDIAQDRAETIRDNPGVVQQLATAYVAIGLIFRRAQIDGA